MQSTLSREWWPLTISILLTRTPRWSATSLRRAPLVWSSTGAAMTWTTSRPPLPPLTSFRRHTGITRSSRHSSAVPTDHDPSTAYLPHRLREGVRAPRTGITPPYALDRRVWRYRTATAAVRSATCIGNVRSKGRCGACVLMAKVRACCRGAGFRDHGAGVGIILSPLVTLMPAGLAIIIIMRPLPFGDQHVAR